MVGIVKMNTVDVGDCDLLVSAKELRLAVLVSGGDIGDKYFAIF